MVQQQQPRTSKEAAAAELARILSGAAPQAVEAARAARPAPTTQPTDVRSTDELLRNGSDAERRAFAQGGTTSTPTDPGQQQNWLLDFAHRNGMPVPQFDKRTTDLAQEIPSVATHVGALASLWNSAKDVVGRPLGFALNLLDLPAQGVEQAVGMLYWNELPLAERWSAGRLTYDSIYKDVFHHDTGKYSAIADVTAGMDWTDLEKKHGSAVGNAIGHFILDPTWLVGGIPLVEAATKGTALERAGAAVGRGLNFSKIPLLRDIPVLGNMGNPITERMLATASEQLNDARGLVDISTGRKSGIFARAFELLPKGKVDQDYGDVRDVLFALGSDHTAWDQTGPSAVRMKQVFDDISSGLFTSVGGLDKTSTVERLNKLLQDPGTKAVLGRMESLRPMSGNAFWDDSEAILKTQRGGFETNMRRLLDRGEQLTPEEAQRYASYRSIKAINEFADKGIPALYDLHKIPAASADIFTHAEQLGAGMRQWLALATLNSPSWAAVNYANNAAMIAMKAGDIRGAGAFAAKLFHPTKMGKNELARLTESGLIEQSAATMAADSAFKEYLVPLADATGEAGKWSRRLAGPGGGFLELGSKFDQGARMSIMPKALADAYHAVWHTGEGGVLGDLPDVLKTLPGYEQWRSGLVMKGTAEIDKLAARADLHSDELLNAHGMLHDWVRTTSGLVDGAADPVEAARIVASQMPDSYLQPVEDLISSARDARHAGNADYLAQLGEHVDDMHDELNLLTFDSAMHDGLQPPAITTEFVRDRLVPWQDQALFSELQGHVREIYSRIIAAHADAGAPWLDNVAEDVGKLMDDYHSTVRTFMQEHSAAEIGAAEYRTYGSELLRFIDERNAGIRSALDHSYLPADARQALDSSLGMERSDLLRSITDRTISRSADAGSEWATALRSDHAAARSNVEEMYRRLGMEMQTSHATAEAPSVGAMTAHLNQNMHDYLEYVKDNLPTAFQKSTVLSPEQTAAMAADAGLLRIAMTQRNFVGAKHAVAMRDFAMLNYTRRYGIDSIISVVFPYHFWISRTSRDWMKMAQARPGAIASIGRLYDSVQEINSDAGIPDRLKTSLRIPVPFLPEHLFGGAGSMYFDPIKLLYPMANFQSDQQADGKNTRLGQMVDYASKLPVGMVNPFMTTGLGAVGALGDREDWLRRSYASVRSVPFGVPGPRVLRAAMDWAGGVSSDPDPTVLTPEIKTKIAAGQSMPMDWLKENLKTVWSVASGEDGFEQYRADRMVANMVGEDPHRWSPRDGMEALKYHSGPLWNAALDRSKQDKGAEVLTGWLFAPLRSYPAGEAVQHGLDSIYREIQAGGDPKAKSEFFKQHPEYRVRQLSQAGSPEEQQQQADTSLYFIDQGAIQDRYEPEIAKLRTNLHRAEELGYLQTKEGRRMISVIKNDVNTLTQSQGDEIDKLNALYPHRQTEISLRASPHERALSALREQFFAIKREDFKSADEFFAARDAFVQALPSQERDPGVWMQFAVKSVATWNHASELAAAQSGRRDTIVQERDTALRALTEQAQPLVSKTEFQAFLGQGKTAPTAESVEYKTATEQMSGYMAIAEAPGQSATTAKALQRSWWNAHPLLQKYYGADEPVAWNAQSAAAYGRMDQLWNGYLKLGQNVRGQRDYLAMHLEELNTNRRSVGLQPLRLLNWDKITQGALQGQPGSIPDKAASAGSGGSAPFR